jgi:pimeloyl-ACP methyl ester carboxylesterase
VECQIELTVSDGGSRFYPNIGKPVLIYLPGLHGDSTLFTSFRLKALKHFQVLEFVYPRNTSWSLSDYGDFVLEELRQHDLKEGWVLAESYGSQVAWSLLQRRSGYDFFPEGIILAGGFVRYPLPWLALTVGRLVEALPPSLWKCIFWMYGRYAHWRHRHAPETRAAIEEFVERRTPADLAAIAHRIRLLAHNDPSFTACHLCCPVYLLAGAIDPVVLTLPVLGWLRRNCRTFSGHRIVWPADHNVLGTEPEKALEQVLEWTNKAQAIDE